MKWQLNIILYLAINWILSQILFDCFFYDPYLQFLNLWFLILLLILVTQYDYKNTMLNPKVHCKSKNTIQYSKNNYIPELLTVNSCWNGVNILVNHKVWYISYVPLLPGVHQLCTTVWAFDLRCESVTYFVTTLSPPCYNLVNKQPCLSLVIILLQACTTLCFYMTA